MNTSPTPLSSCKIDFHQFPIVELFLEGAREQGFRLSQSTIFHDFHYIFFFFFHSPRLRYARDSGLESLGSLSSVLSFYPLSPPCSSFFFSLYPLALRASALGRAKTTLFLSTPAGWFFPRAIFAGPLALYSVSRRRQCSPSARSTLNEGLLFVFVLPLHGVKYIMRAKYTGSRVHVRAASGGFKRRFIRERLSTPF